MAAQNGQALISAAWMLVAAALGIAVVYLLWRANPDYYEDVLSLSQEKFEIRALAAQGRQHPSAFTRRKVRVGRSGLTGGWGASAFFFKHMTEMRREGVLFIDQKTLLTALAVGIISFSMREVFDDASTFLSIMLMGMLYMQMIFNMATGRFTQELLKPFFYLAPATARGKLIWANIQPALKATLDALVCFVAAVFLAGVDPVQAVLASLVVGLCNLLGTGGLLLSEWILGENRSKMLGAMLYFIAVIFVLAPGVVLYFVIGAVLPQLPLLPYVAFILYGVGASALLFLLLGGMLHNVETA